MRFALAAASAAILSLVPCSAASAATLHVLGYQPNTRLQIVDTVTASIVPGPDPVWPAYTADLAVLGGRVYNLSVLPGCSGPQQVFLNQYDLVTGITGGQTALALSVTPGIAKSGGLASDGTRLVVSFNQPGHSTCGAANILGDLDPDGAVTNLRVFPEAVDLDKIVFTPDGRLLAINSTSLAHRLYGVDLAALSVTLLGTHPTTNSTSSYFDLAFTADGELWGLERDASFGQRLRRIDPLTGASALTVSLPPTTTMQFRGLAVLPAAPTPATAASWGRVKGTYR